MIIEFGFEDPESTIVRPDAGYDGEIRPGMVICVENFSGADTGQGAKLEQKCLITGTGVELLSTFPFEERLMG